MEVKQNNHKTFLNTLYERLYIMKLANFKNTVINTNYGFDTENQVVVNRNTNKAMTWEASGKVRLSINGERKRFSREEIVADVEVIVKKERQSNKDTIAAQFRSKLAGLLESGKTKDEARVEMLEWVSDKIARKSDRNIYFNRAYKKVSVNPSKHKL